MQQFVNIDVNVEIGDVENYVHCINSLSQTHMFKLSKNVYTYTGLLQTGLSSNFTTHPKSLHVREPFTSVERLEAFAPYMQLSTLFITPCLD